MTALQKQCLLTYLGFDCGGIDGIWGERSAAATAEFQEQRGLEADGVFGAETEAEVLSAVWGGKGWWDGIRHFSREEFGCKCGNCGGFPAEPAEKLVKLADMVREYFDAPALVSSGVRCPVHNMAVGGVANSRHLTGKAMDFCVRGRNSGEILDYVNRQNGIRYAYAIESQYIHMDVE